MINFDILNRFTGATQFVAEIDATESDARSLKLGLAVKWAVKNRANLRDANLGGAYLRDANLQGASLRGADLQGANLEGAGLQEAYLRGANLRDAILQGASLRGAYLRDANLQGASLRGANLEGADLREANLWGANLRDADLRGADLQGASLLGAYLRDANLQGAGLQEAYLRGADLQGASLLGVSGVNEWVKCIQLEQYPITYTADILQIGCEKHQIADWVDFDDARILKMDGKLALKFWRKYKAWIFATIELCPAKPTKSEAAA